MILKVGGKYKTRCGDIATITHHISKLSRIYTFKGSVKTKKGTVKRALCMWTSSGAYEVGHDSSFDIIEEL